MSDLIFIVGRQRSGTSVFRAHLHRLGALDAGEIFHNAPKNNNTFYVYLADRVKECPQLIHPTHHGQAFRDYIAHLRQLSKGAPIAMDVKYFGLHLIPFWGSRIGRTEYFIINFMRASEARVIHIIRKNKLRIHVSEMIAKATGVWSYVDAGIPPSQERRVTLDCAKLLQKLRNLDHEEKAAAERLNRSVPSHRALIYEEMFLPDGRFASAAIAAMEWSMGKSVIDAMPNHRKANPEPLHDLIVNFDAVANTLAPTRFSWMCNG